MHARRSGVSTAGAVFALALACACAACGSTTDSIGYDGPGDVHLRPLRKLAKYPNPFHDLGKSDADIATKISNWFTALFHGDSTQAIYFETAPDQANVQDVLHGKEVRTEGIGLAMMICVQLDRREEFDRLWTYATAMLEYKDAPKRGYFQSWCNNPTATEPCDDPYGESQMTMALIFAHDRWDSTTTIDYEKAAVSLLTAMRHKQDENRGVVSGVTNTFDAATGLPFVVPTDTAASADRGSPSIVMPAYYDLWEQATGDPFWTRAAVAARAYWQRAANATTGLTPVQATFAGARVVNFDTYLAEAYRAQINMAVDWIWTAGTQDPWERKEANNLLTFFTGKGILTYGASFTLEGMAIDPARDNALIATNGVTAMVSDNLDRGTYINEAWGLAPPIGLPRYYAGILGLTSLLMLSGQFVIW